MGFRRCSTCGISYPPSIYVCHVCSEACDYSSHGTPDADWQEKVRLARVAAELNRELSEEELVGAWRFLNLLEAGYDPAAACKIAADFRVDLHKACEMLEQECSPETAVAILL